MKTKLAPEPEREVTPGKKAVEDLEGLATPGEDRTVLHKLRALHSSSVMEEVPALEVSKHRIPSERDLTGNIPTKETLLTTVCLAQNAEGYVPSSALTCQILNALYEHRHKGPEMQEILEAWIEAEFLGCWQNTILNHNAGKVIHYPTNSDYGRATNPDINPWRSRYEWIIPLYDKYVELRFSDMDTDDVLKDTISVLTGFQDPYEFKSLLDNMGLAFILHTGMPGDNRNNNTGQVWIRFGVAQLHMYLNGEMGDTACARMVVQQ